MSKITYLQFFVVVVGVVSFAHETTSPDRLVQEFVDKMPQELPQVGYTEGVDERNNEFYKAVIQNDRAMRAVSASLGDIVPSDKALAGLLSAANLPQSSKNTNEALNNCILCTRYVIPQLESHSSPIVRMSAMMHTFPLHNSSFLLRATQHCIAGFVDVEKSCMDSNLSLCCRPAYITLHTPSFFLVRR